MDKITIGVIVVLIIVIGIFVWFQFGNDSVVNTAVQVGGGGCGA